VRRGRRPLAALSCAAAATLVCLVTLVSPVSPAAPASASGGAGVVEEALSVPVGAEPDGTAVSLDAELHLPAGAGAQDPAPAVLLAHGFGGSKDDLAAQARALASDGYVVLAWTARGFGASGGAVHLDDPDYEVADAAALVDLLAQRPEVAQDAPGDPRVGVAGASYGGAVGLLLAGTDPRVDAVASAITWSDLSTALDPGGVFKAGWASQLLSSLTGAAVASGTSTDPAQVACGRLDPALCAGYVQAARSGVVPGALAEQLQRSSPAAVLPSTRAAVLLVQGEGDSLFGLADSLANAEAAQRAGVPVSLAWVAGGHDGGFDAAGFEDRSAAWFEEHLRGAQPEGGPSAPFSAAVPRQELFGGDRGSSGSSQQDRTLEQLPPLGGTGQQVALEAAGPGAVLSPAGGRPAALTALPGVGDVASLAGLAGAAGAAGGGGFSTAVLPGQAAVFESAPLEQDVTLLGASTVRLSITSSADDAVLFASLADVSPDGSSALPGGLVSPVRVSTVPGQPTEVDVTLPAVVRDVAAGHRLRLVVATTDSAYAVPTDPRVYSVALADGSLALAAGPPGVEETAGRSFDVPWAHVAVLGAVLLAALLLALVSGLRRRRSPEDASAAGSEVAPGDVVMAVHSLEKVYGDGFRAVDGVSFEVRRGQVVGLLGPNGAGKTTTLRMLMGLLRPSAGSLEVLGQAVRPGSPVLMRVGALVEGPGFLPHLSGLANLRLYWASTGRPLADARMDEALEVAGLGDAVHRRVRGYSQGMRQRLGIAQAMLGMPDLLVLDEPTNGLDPPQINAMRTVLRDYAATGRTVLVSSHLLSEVEATCSHAVVMARGRVLATGSVAELVAGSGEVLVGVGDGQAQRALEVLAPLLERDGGRALGEREGGALVSPGRSGTGPLVGALVAAGVEVTSVVPQRHLEEVFLELVGAA